MGIRLRNGVFEFFLSIGADASRHDRPCSNIIRVGGSDKGYRICFGDIGIRDEFAANPG